MTKRKPIVTAISYLACLVIAVMLSLQFEGIQTYIEHANEIKPYAYLFGQKIENTGEKSIIICLGDSISFYPPDERGNLNNPTAHLPMLVQEVMNRQEHLPRAEVHEWTFQMASWKK